MSLLDTREGTPPSATRPASPVSIRPPGSPGGGGGSATCVFYRQSPPPTTLALERLLLRVAPCRRPSRPGGAGEPAPGHPSLRPVPASVGNSRRSTFTQYGAFVQ